MYYKKVYIKTQADLPEGGYYPAHMKDSTLDNDYKQRLFNEDYEGYWLENIDWYLLPTDEIELLKELCEAHKKLERNVTMQLVTPEPTTQEMADNRYQVLKQEAELRQKIKTLTKQMEDGKLIPPKVN